MGLILGQDQPQMPVAEDQHLVSDLRPGGEHEPFRVSVRARAAGRDLHGRDVGSGQDRVKRRGELPGPVPDQEPEVGIAAQDINAARGPSSKRDLAGPEKRRYLLAGLLVCGTCRRRMESAWSNGKPACRCRHGHTTAAKPDPERPKNTNVREDRIVPHLSALHVLLTGANPVEGRRRRTRRGIDVRRHATAEDVTGYLREQQITLTYDPAAGTLHAGNGKAAQTITLKAS
jgi:hypothetical protein